MAKQRGALLLPAIAQYLIVIACTLLLSGGQRLCLTRGHSEHSKEPSSIRTGAVIAGADVSVVNNATNVEKRARRLAATVSIASPIFP